MVMTDRTLPTEGHASRVMPPVGPEMDALVVAALGCPELNYAEPSRCIGDAVWAIEEWRKQHPEWSIDIYFNPPCHPGRWKTCLYDASGEDEFTPYDAHADTLEAAICEAIIRAQWALEDAK